MRPRGGGLGLVVNRLANLAVPLSLVVLLIALVHYVRWSLFALGYPYGLDYGEGIVWQQMRSIVAGQGYAPIGVYPAIVFHYPPIFHLASAAVASMTGLDQLASGRLVSILSTAVAVPLAGALAESMIATSERRLHRLIVAAIAALSPLATTETMFWSATMRVDLLAIMLGLAGLLLVIRSHDRPVLILPAALAFTLALYTKQTAIAAPIAAFAGLIAIHPRRALVLLVACVALGGGVLAFISARTHGGFLVHIVIYNVNRLDLRLAGELIRQERSVFWFLALAVVGATATVRRLAAPGLSSLSGRLRADPRLFAQFVLLLFLGVRAAMLPMMLKSGASTNYLVEWMFAVSIFVGASIVPLLRFSAGDCESPPRLLPFLVAIGIPYQAATVPDLMPDPAVRARAIAENQELVTLISKATKPVVGDDMVLLLRAGQAVKWEPAIVAELAHAGRYDERAFAAMIRRHTFAFFMIESGGSADGFNQRYDPVIANAIDAAYPIKRRVGDVVLHFPGARDRHR